MLIKIEFFLEKLAAFVADMDAFLFKGPQEGIVDLDNEVY